MFKVIATDVVISKGFDNAPALRFSEKGDSVRFRIGKKVYDTRAENNTRWFNVSVKAFGDVCERIKKMQLKEGSFVHLTGRLDEESWIDQSMSTAEDGLNREELPHRRLMCWWSTVRTHRSVRKPHFLQRTFICAALISS